MNKSLEKIDEQINQIEAKLADPHLCDGSASVYSRISGYYRPVENWNTGKQQEMVERREYDLKIAA